MNTEIRNNKDQNRFEIWSDGVLAGFIRYYLGHGRITFVHTEVNKAYEGKGLGSQLARATLDDARTRGLMVVPLCPFIAGYIERHLDEYRDLVTPEMLSGERP